MNISLRARIDANNHALAEYPRESCGLLAIVDGEQVYHRCLNIAETPSEHFVLPGDEWARVEDLGEIVMLVHSHPNAEARASQGDLVSCEVSGIPWLIISVMPHDSGEVRIAADNVIVPQGYEAPLVGREFCFGVLDCWTLIRDWWKREKGVVLPDFTRRDNFWKAGREVDLYSQFPQADFREVTDGTLLPGDVVMMQVRSKIANHAGVYIGDGLILHHMYGRLSSRDVYGGYWKEITRRVVRHSSCC